MGQKAKVLINKVYKLGNFLDSILIINSCHADDKTIMTRKCHTLFSNRVLS